VERQKREREESAKREKEEAERRQQEQAQQEGTAEMQTDAQQASGEGSGNAAAGASPARSIQLQPAAATPPADGATPVEDAAQAAAGPGLQQTQQEPVEKAGPSSAPAAGGGTDADAAGPSQPADAGGEDAAGDAEEARRREEEERLQRRYQDAFEALPLPLVRSLPQVRGSCASTAADAPPCQPVAAACGPGQSEPTASLTPLALAPPPAQCSCWWRIGWPTVRLRC
jgi:hypothetical protein